MRAIKIPPRSASRKIRPYCIFYMLSLYAIAIYIDISHLSIIEIFTIIFTIILTIFVTNLILFNRQIPYNHLFISLSVTRHY